MTSKTLMAQSLDELPGVASALIADLPNDKIFAFYGKMGAGKTTLIKAICDVLRVKEIVSSPTFALVNEYTTAKDEPVFHFDFYRIKKIEEVYDIGYEEYFYNDYYCLVEWPELVADLLPERYVKVEIEVGNNDEREITYRVVAS